MGTMLGLEGSVKNMVDKGFTLLIVVGVIFLIFQIGKTLLTALIKRNSKNNNNPHLATLLTVIRSAWKYFMLMIGLISVLNIFGMSVTANSLMAAAGVSGLVLGIGAQDFIKDIVNGFSIILENQYAVGDYICVNGLFGTVAGMSLRTTRIVGDFDETLTIPNSDIGTVINYSKKLATVKCHVYITKEQQLQEALKTLKLMAMDFKSSYAKGNAKLMGVTALLPYGIEVRINCQCQAENMVALRCELNNHIAQALSEADISFINQELSLGAFNN